MRGSGRRPPSTPPRPPARSFRRRHRVMAPTSRAGRWSRRNGARTRPARSSSYRRGRPPSRTSSGTVPMPCSAARPGGRSQALSAMTRTPATVFLPTLRFPSSQSLPGDRARRRAGGFGVSGRLAVRPVAPRKGASRPLAVSRPRAAPPWAGATRRPLPVASGPCPAGPADRLADEELLFLEHHVGIARKPWEVSGPPAQGQEQGQQSRTAQPEVVVDRPPVEHHAKLGVTLEKGPATDAASPSTNAHVPDSRNNRSSNRMSSGWRRSRWRSRSSTVAMRRSCTGTDHNASTRATTSSRPSAGNRAQSDLATARTAGTGVP